MKQLTIDVWSDIACPWCSVGKRRLDSALSRFGHSDAVEVRWRAFELDPGAPRLQDASSSYAERLARKYRIPVAQAEEMIARMTGVAAQDGLDFRFDRIRPGNTFDAHRLLHLAAVRGGPALQGRVKERLFAAYFAEGAAIGDPEVLVAVARECGIEEDDARALLDGDAFAEEVRRDELEARELGIRGVPFFVIGGKYAISGAHPAAVLLAAIEKAWSELPEATTHGDAHGAVCGPDGCA